MINLAKRHFSVGSVVLVYDDNFKKSENELAFRLDVENGRVPGDDVAVLRLDVIHQRYEVGQLDVDVARRARYDHVARLQQFGIVQDVDNLPDEFIPPFHRPPDGLAIPGTLGPNSI